MCKVSKQSVSLVNMSSCFTESCQVQGPDTDIITLLTGKVTNISIQFLYPINLLQNYMSVWRQSVSPERGQC